MIWVVEEHFLEINIILIQYMSVCLYSGTSTRQVWFIADTQVQRLLFLGIMKLTDWTTQLKSYKKSYYSEQFMAGTFLQSELKLLS